MAVNLLLFIRGGQVNLISIALTASWDQYRIEKILLAYYSSLCDVIDILGVTAISIEDIKIIGIDDIGIVFTWYRINTEKQN